MAEPFIGEIRMFVCDYAPQGWAFCDGSIISIAQNTTLFAVISDLYGGDGRSTMGLPNLQGRIPMGPRRGPGLTQRFVAESLGAPGISLNQFQMPEHSHGIKASDSPATTNLGEGQLLASRDDNPGTIGVVGTYVTYTHGQTPTTTMAEESLQNTGSSESHENMQPFLTVNYCIALDGIFPSRS